MTVRILIGDVRERLKELADESVHCVVTSPPYFGLRDYGMAGQIGLEPTPAAFVSELVEVFREVRRVLRSDGTCWVNLGDSYGKAKQLLGVPWRFALSMQADGWTLRQDCIWAKPNAMPEPARDRCVGAHEYMFLFSKQEHYRFDAQAIAEPALQPVGEAKLTGQHKANAGGFTNNGASTSTLGSNQADAASLPLVGGQDEQGVRGDCPSGTVAGRASPRAPDGSRPFGDHQHIA